jgi:SAM-dependent methyltransferase
MHFERLKDLEKKNYFWFAGRYITIKNFINKLKPESILDLGCGSGNLLKNTISEHHDVTGIDILPEAVKYCKKRIPDANFLQADATSIPFKKKRFDLIIALDVIEHIEDDLNFLKEVRSTLKDDGKIIITAPAYQSLFSKWDRIQGHFRRYSTKKLVSLTEKAGYSITYKNYYNFFLFPIFLISRILELNESNPGKLTNYILKNLIEFEAKLSKIIRYPAGSTIVLVAKKRCD